MRTELSEIYDFRLGFWKGRLGGRSAFYVLIVGRPLALKALTIIFSVKGSLQPMAFENQRMEMYVFDLPDLISQAGKEWALIIFWS